MFAQSLLGQSRPRLDDGVDPVAHVVVRQADRRRWTAPGDARRAPPRSRPDRRWSRRPGSCRCAGRPGRGSRPRRTSRCRPALSQPPGRVRAVGARDSGRWAACPPAGAYRSRRSRRPAGGSPSSSKAAISPHGHLAHRAAVLQPLGAGDDGHRLGLGAGVELHDHVRPQPVDPGLLQPGRAGRGQVPDGAAGWRRRTSPAPSSGQAPDAAHHGRHQIDPGAAVRRLTAFRVSSASKRGSTTRCAPWCRPPNDEVNGPL